MKTISHLIFILIILSSCSHLEQDIDLENDNDLANEDEIVVEPNDPSQLTDVSDNMDGVFADLYLQFATYGANGNLPVHDFDGGMASFQRAIFIAEEIPTDEASWLWDPSSYGTINHGIVVPSLDCVFGFYSRLMINISVCNQFIQMVNQGYFKPNEGESDAAFKARKDNYVRQAKILWAGCYYYMLSFYDKVPYADFDTPIGSLPTQMTRAKVYENVTGILEEVVASYNNDNSGTIYGFVGLDAAEAILAKIYLNGEVFAGRADYDLCYAHCHNIIKRLGKGGYYGNGLARSYHALFGYNNDQYTVGHKGNAVNEIIWTIPQDRVMLTSYSGATFLIAGWIGTNGVEVTTGTPTTDKTLDGKVFKTERDEKRYYQYYDNTVINSDGKTDFAKAEEAFKELKDWQKNISETQHDVHYSFDPKAAGCISQNWFNANNGWKCMVARKSFVNKFDWNDVGMSQSDDMRVALWQTSAHNFTAENPSLLGDDWGKNGYLAIKYSNWAYNDDGTINYPGSPEPTDCVGGDYAVIRLAEIYLTAAECILKVCSGEDATPATALKYVNYIRERAYGDTEHNWASVSMQELRDERCRELYQENNRRTDLIRWNQWCTGYTWQWKGGLATGTNLPEYTKCYPIPTRVMVSSNFEQTTGY